MLQSFETEERQYRGSGRLGKISHKLPLSSNKSSQRCVMLLKVIMSWRISNDGYVEERIIVREVYLCTVIKWNNLHCYPYC